MCLGLGSSYCEHVWHFTGKSQIRRERRFSEGKCCSTVQCPVEGQGRIQQEREGGWGGGGWTPLHYNGFVRETVTMLVMLLVGDK